MRRDRKAFPIAACKAVNADAGIFEAVVSVFGNVDLTGDRVMPGAFTASLADWKSSGDPIPVIWSHQWADPKAHVGGVLEAAELPPGDPRLPAALRDLGGLWTKFQLDLEGGDSYAPQVARLLSKRRVKEFSFAYEVVDEQKANDGANDLLAMNVFEVGPTLKGMNPDTVLMGAKAAADDPAQKANVSLAGSQEQARSAILEAVRSWARELLGQDYYYAAIEATFDDHVVVYVERWSEPYDGGSYYSIDYQLADDNTVTLGDPTAVAIEGTVVPKARSWGAKEGRRNSTTDAERIQSVHDMSVELGADCATLDSTDGASGDNDATIGINNRDRVAELLLTRR